MALDTNSTQAQIPSLLQVARRDRIYSTKEAYRFAFGEDVVAVFDDMISRSVPAYLDLQLLVSSCAKKFYRSGTALYDLGCSTGTSLILMAKQLEGSNTNLIGVDSSEPMLTEAKRKLTALNMLSQVKLLDSSLETIVLNRSSFITSNYTIQFMPQEQRLPLLKKICSALTREGAFLITEKIQPDENAELIKELHEDFKKQNGYSDLEVARKRDSLKGFMLPIAESEAIAELYTAGFQKVVPIMGGYSFKTWLCLKQ